MSTPRPWQKRYTVKQTYTGKLVVMVSQFRPIDIPGEWEWSNYFPAGLNELREIIMRLDKNETP